MAIRAPVGRTGKSQRPVKKSACTSTLASRTVSVAEAKRDFSEICARAGYGGDSTVVTKRGRPIAAIIGIADLERFAALQDEQAKRILGRAIATARPAVPVRLD